MSEEKMMNSLASESEAPEDESVRINDDIAAKIAVDYQRKKIDKLQEEIEDIKQDRDQRKKFSSHIFIFMCAYMAVAIIIVFLCGFHVMCLKESVLITLLSTTLANVIGVFTFVAKYLFHNK